MPMSSRHLAPYVPCHAAAIPSQRCHPGCKSRAFVVQLKSHSSVVQLKTLSSPPVPFNSLPLTVTVTAAANLTVTVTVTISVTYGYPYR